MKNFSFPFAFLFLVILSPISVQSQTTIPAGNVMGNWTKANSPYLVQGDILIPDKQTLTIEAGTRIEFSPSKYLMVKGSIIAEGTESENIFFTVPDTSGSWDMETFNGGWGGLRFIHFESEQDSSKLKYCTFEYGKAVSDMWNLDNGGAICVEDFDKLEISNCLFRKNLAGGPNFSQGGALAIHNSDIDIFSNTFRDNRAGASGAVYVSVSDVIFRGNTFDNNTAENGGAMYINNSNLTFENDQFTGNYAENNGAVLFVSDYERSRIEFTSATFTGNEAGNNAGVLEAGNAELIFNKCTFSDNTSGWIGGALNIYNCVLNLNNSNLTNNTAPIFGGVMGSYDSDIRIDRCTMTGNYAGVLGGAIHSDWSLLNINNSVFERDSSDETGGALWLWHCDAYFDECEFNENYAQYNGGAIGADSTNIHIDNSEFNSNISVWGGAIIHSRAEMHLTDCAFTGNTGEHGGVINTGWCDLYITTCDFNQNKGIWGGAVDAFNCNMEIDFCTFTGNEASDLGGAIYYIVDTVDISPDKELNYRMIGSDFISNSSLNGMSAIYAQQLNDAQHLKTFIADQCRFEDNHSATNGVFRILGGIPDVLVSNTIFKDNRTEASRSTFGIQIGCKGLVYNCLFIDNHPRGAIVHNNSEVAFTNCTFTGTTESALDLRRGAIAKVTNSIIWNNGSTGVLTQGAGEACQLIFNYCDVEYGKDSILINDSISMVSWGIGNISLDPKFINPGADNYQLFYSSPCLEAGIESLEVDGEMIYAPDDDFEGNPRPMPAGTNPDMGAYESSVPAGIENRIALRDQNVLYQNIPNPVEQFTEISWIQSGDGKVRLDILDIKGMIVKSLINRIMPSGYNSETIQCGDMKPGVYFYRIITADMVETKSMQIVR